MYKQYPKHGSQQTQYINRSCTIIQAYTKVRQTTVNVWTNDKIRCHAQKMHKRCTNDAQMMHKIQTKRIQSTNKACTIRKHDTAYTILTLWLNNPFVYALDMLCLIYSIQLSSMYNI